MDVRMSLLAITLAIITWGAGVIPTFFQRSARISGSEATRAEGAGAKPLEVVGLVSSYDRKYGVLYLDTGDKKGALLLKVVNGTKFYTSDGRPAHDRFVIVGDEVGVVYWNEKPKLASKVVLLDFSAEDLNAALQAEVEIRRKYVKEYEAQLKAWRKQQLYKKLSPTDRRKLDRWYDKIGEMKQEVQKRKSLEKNKK